METAETNAERNIIHENEMNYFEVYKGKQWSP